MKTLLLRSTFYVLVGRAQSSYTTNLLTIPKISPLAIGTKCLQTKASEALPLSRSAKFPNKRVSYKQTEDQMRGRWSVIAYNLSEELKIDNARKLLETFGEYQINELPEDLQDEAVMLSLKSFENNERSKQDQPLHDLFLFREGSIVFWGVPYEQQKRIIYGLTSLKIDPYANELIQEEREHLSYSLEQSSDKSKLDRDVIRLSTKKESSQLLLDQFAFSHAVALSVKLGIWELILDKYIESVGWVTGSMKGGQGIKLTRDQVFRKTGELYELKHCINLSSGLLDLPDVYWDREEQEGLFLAMTSFLNIKKRTAVMNEKLNNCCELMNLLACHLNDKHHIRLEWMIIVLIMVEVLFEIARLF